MLPEEITIPFGTKVSFDLLIDELPDGLSGYNITMSLSNPNVADIQSVSFPTWATMHSNSNLPSDTVWIKTIDLTDQIKEDATNITLATINISAEDCGTTDIDLSVSRLDDDNGYPILVNIQNSELHFLCLTPLPGQQNYPTDLDGDGLYEDLNGNGLLDFDDVVNFFQSFEWLEDNYPIDLIDINGNGLIDFDDIISLFEEV
jgi:PKD repeat protein